MGKHAPAPAMLDAGGLRFAVAASRYNIDITEALLEGVERELLRLGGRRDEVDVYWVPGAFELPLTAKLLAESRRFDAVVCVGAVIRGETAHFEYVAGQCAEGLTRAALDSGVPVVFGVLTVDDRDQALARVGGREGHKGEEAARTAVEMARLARQVRSLR